MKKTKTKKYRIYSNPYSEKGGIITAGFVPCHPARRIRNKKFWFLRKWAIPKPMNFAFKFVLKTYDTKYYLISVRISVRILRQLETLDGKSINTNQHLTLLCILRLNHLTRLFRFWSRTSGPELLD